MRFVSSAPLVIANIAGDWIILFENAPKAYKIHRHWKPVFNNLNIRIDSGDAIGICGANGAGKSTLMRMLAGAVPQTGGKITMTMSTSSPIGFTGAFQTGRVT